jgi:hypothetical protein
MQQKRVIAGVVGIVAIVLLVWGCYSRSWLYESRNEVSLGLGLLGAEGCEGGTCHAVSFSEMGERDAFWKYIGWAGTGAVLGTGVLCVLLVLTAVVGLARTTAPPGRGVTVTLILSILALLGGIVAAIGMKQGFREASDIAYGPAMYAYLAGAVAAIVASGLLRSSRGIAPVTPPPA